MCGVVVEGICLEEERVVCRREVLEGLVGLALVCAGKFWSFVRRAPDVNRGEERYSDVVR